MPMSSSELRRVHVPGDKSITHRALMLAALATGTSRIRGALESGDTGSTRRTLEALGVLIDSEGGDLRVAGRGLRGLTKPADTLDCGNSGTTARLLLGVLAAQPLEATLTGDASLRGRPMRRVTSPLLAMGARIRELGAADRLPVQVTGGALRSLRYASPAASAQVKSALLLAALAAGVEVEVTEPLVSRDHSERMLRGLGVRVEEVFDARGHVVSLEPVTILPPSHLTVPGDFSAAAFLLAAAQFTGVEIIIENVGVNPTRTGLLAVFERMGGAASLLEARVAGGEPVADLLVRPRALRGTVVTAPEIPGLIDEVPALAALAATAEGETTISGAGELRFKESDRIAILVANLRAIGVGAEELPDGLVVQGTRGPLRGRVSAAGDHRIAMAFGTLGAAPGNEIEIDDRAAAAVSFPGFWRELRALRASA
jgi:3-phosphoshikimate 1-carboxyvinyltransferase